MIPIDWAQWRALVVTGIRLDLRAPGAVQGGAAGIQRLLALGAMNLVLGLALGALALFVPDVFVSGSLVLTVTMVLVAISIVMEFAVVVISPLDYDVLGCQPISGATYLAARVANVLFYTALITTTLALLPMIAFFFAHGFSPLVGLAGIVAVYLGCLTTTLAMVALYVATARLVHPQRLRRVLTYVQLVASFSIYGAYFLLPELFRPRVLATWTVRRTWWMLLYPPTWFASYLEIASGHWTAMELLPAIGSVVALASLMVVVARRLSLDYSETLSRHAARTDAAATKRRASIALRFATGERRAVILLIRAQFRHDQRFRLGVLSVVPLSVFYLLLSLKDGQLVDPFVSDQANGVMLVYFAVLFIPLMLLVAVSRSDAYRAAWIFHATPARRADLVMAAKDFTVTYLLGPYLGLLALVLAYFFGNAVHAFVHVLIQGLIANLMLMLAVALQPNLPFSQPVQKGQFTAGFVVVMLVGSIAQPISSLLLSAFVYPHPAAVVAVVASLLGGAIGGQALLRRRLERVMAGMEFVG